VELTVYRVDLFRLNLRRKRVCFPLRPLHRNRRDRCRIRNGIRQWNGLQVVDPAAMPMNQFRLLRLISVLAQFLRPLVAATPTIVKVGTLTSYQRGVRVHG
jgi:hypothetical protein